MSKKSDNLLKKYYSGDTSLEEEKQIKKEFLESSSSLPEKDIFTYYEGQGSIPDGLEEQMVKAIYSKETKRYAIKRNLLKLSSAAVVLVVLSIFLNVRSQKKQHMEDQFFEMERAMFQISESLQPEMPDEMVVLWVDDNVEIIIN